MFNIPQDFEKRMQGQLKDEYPAFIASYDEGRIWSLRLNTLKMHDCEELPFPTTPVDWCPEGFYYDENEKPGTHPYHEAGAYYIQDASAMYPAEFLSVNPGDRVLDLCAAPGGKSTQIGAKLRGQGLLVANEVIPSRAKILSENIERCGIRNAVVTCEAPENLAASFPSFFDKVLVDAPCSGEGMFRKNPEAIGEWSLENVKMCAERQSLILEEACKMLAVEGTLVYSTCTFSPDENEEMTAQFLKKHPGFELIEEKRLWPHKIKGEGHFAAKLLKKDEEVFNPYETGLMDSSLHNIRPANRKSCKRSSDNSGKYESDALKQFLEFAKDIASADFLDKITGSGTPVLFGENLYLLPEALPSVSGMKVIRPGLHLGTVKKNRFEPAHALAMTMSPKDALNVIDLPSSGRQIRDYLSGNVISAENKESGDGWTLICTDGYSCGWGKITGNSVKNHYPKGLRKVLQ